MQLQEGVTFVDGVTIKLIVGRRKEMQIKLKKENTTQVEEGVPEINKLKKELEQRGFAQIDVSEIDSSYIKIPNKLDSLASPEISKYFTALTQHKVCLNAMYAEIDVLYFYYSEEFNLAFAQAISSFPVKLSKGEKELLFINSDSTAMEYRKRLVGLEVKKKLLTTLIASTSEALTLISREITRQQGDLFGQRRGDNIQHGK